VSALDSLPVRIIISDPRLLESDIRLHGWVKSSRHSKAGFSFVMVNDGSCLESLQVIVPDTLANYDQIRTLHTGSAVEIDGRLVESTGKNQRVEVQAKSVALVGSVEQAATYPIAKKHHTLEYLRTVAHLRPRTNIFGAIARLRNTLAYSIHSYFHQRGFSWVNTPVISTSDCEGAGELFAVSTLNLAALPKTEDGVDFKKDFFGRPAWLTVSGQLQLEAYCLALSKVYAFGPTFRAENSNTNRHLAEFWMIEPEIAFANLKDNADLAEDFLKSVCASALSECPNEMNFFVDRVEKRAVDRLQLLVKKGFHRIDYTEAIDILQHSRQKFEFPVAWGLDLKTEHERYLTEKHFDNHPVILMNYPKAIKAFYMRQNQDKKTVAAMDVLVPGMGEIIGGGQREERAEELGQALKASQLDQELGWYLDLRRYGSVPHAGFGLGFERLLGYISGVSNVRDLIPFPRVPGQADF